ncbi:organic solute carrier partner 1 [Oratosquilla oratoria]|uniref:organic solute carrier partner 1 n=1 Tax=Oratosquilla oratoria TaxID=337810 RepID=UPI003F76B920
MTLQALPLQFLNLGGEMMYIIDQRLRAQNIPYDRAAKVRNDIVAIMLNRRFVEELFKPQPMYSRKALRTVFDKLAHGSIMRLNQPSMDKLYDLMVMALKYQMVKCPRPEDLLLITLNHLDAIRNFVTTHNVITQVEAVYSLFLKVYRHMSAGALYDIRIALLGFLQDTAIRVSVFLKDGSQTPQGIFVLRSNGPVPSGVDVPGNVHVFDENGEVHQTFHFVPGEQYSSSEQPGSLEIFGDRCTALGRNMYSSPEDEEPVGPHQRGVRGQDSHSPPGELPSNILGEANSADGMRAREELNLLAQLIGSAASATRKEFRLNLFTSDQEEEDNSQLDMESADQIIKIDGGCRGDRPELGKIFGELLTLDDPEPVDKGQDLLDLMDSI